MEDEKKFMTTPTNVWNALDCCAELTALIIVLTASEAVNAFFAALFGSAASVITSIAVAAVWPELIPPIGVTTTPATFRFASDLMEFLYHGE